MSLCLFGGGSATQTTCRGDTVCHPAPGTGCHLAPRSGCHLSPRTGCHLSPRTSGRHLSPRTGCHLPPKTSCRHLPPIAGLVATFLSGLVATFLPGLRVATFLAGLRVATLLPALHVATWLPGHGAATLLSSQDWLPLGSHDCVVATWLRGLSRQLATRSLSLHKEDSFASSSVIPVFGAQFAAMPRWICLERGLDERAPVSLALVGLLEFYSRAGHRMLAKLLVLSELRLADSATEFRMFQVIHAVAAIRMAALACARDVVRLGLVIYQDTLVEERFQGFVKWLKPLCCRSDDHACQGDGSFACNAATSTTCCTQLGVVLDTHLDIGQKE